MPDVNSLDLWWWWINLAANGAAIGRFLQLGLYREYIAFFCLLVLDFAISAAGAVLGAASKAYFYLYGLSRPVALGLSVAVVLEIFYLTFKAYQGIATAGRIAMRVAFWLSSIAAGVVILPTLIWSNPRWALQSKFLYYTALAEYPVLVALAVFALLMVSSVVCFPLWLQRNALVHCMICTIYFVTTALMLSLGQFFPDRFHFMVLNVCTEMVSTACFIAWCLGLRRDGNRVRVEFRRRVQPHQVDRLLKLLESMDDALKIELE